jgi:hypothetical protein
MRVELSFACFGLEVRDSKVVRVAPITKWCLGKSAEYVRNYWLQRGAKVTAT